MQASADLPDNPIFASAHVTNRDYGYLDIELVDRSPKAARRLWTITKASDGKMWASLRRSDDDDSEFLDEVYLPPKMVLILAAAAAPLLDTPILGQCA